MSVLGTVVDAVSDFTQSNHENFINKLSDMYDNDPQAQQYMTREEYIKSWQDASRVGMMSGGLTTVMPKFAEYAPALMRAAAEGSVSKAFAKEGVEDMAYGSELGLGQSLDRFTTQLADLDGKAYYEDYDATDPLFAMFKMYKQGELDD